MHWNLPSQHVGSCRPRWSGAGTGIVNTFRPIKQRRVVPSFTDACCRPLLMINEALAGTSQFIISFFISSPWFLECVKNEFLRYSQFQQGCMALTLVTAFTFSAFDVGSMAHRFVCRICAYYEINCCQMSGLVSRELSKQSKQNCGRWKFAADVGRL